MDRDTVWGHTHGARRTLLDLLRGLDDRSWDVDSLCAGWTVRDVAAHVMAGSQTGFAQLPAMMWRGRFNVDRSIYLDAKRRAKAPLEEILADYDRYAFTRRHVPVTTHVEPLVDVLVHTQDIARPLGLTVQATPEAAAFGADRARLLAPVLGTRRLLRQVRMVATDTPWDRGKGAVIEGPALELLLLCTGREADRSALSGEGVALLP